MDWKRRLVKKFKPIVVLHPEEDYFPASIDYILYNSRLYLPDDQCLVPKGQLNRNNLPSYSQKYGAGVYVNIDPSIWDGQEYKMSDVPFYVACYETDTYYVLQYIFIYAYNGAFTILGEWKAGAHQFDCEHTTFFIDKATEKLEKGYFAAHRSKDGEWINKEKIIRFGSQPVIFSAKHSHASYWKMGKVYRVCCFANDVAGDGKHWDPKNCEIIDNTTNWNKFTGTFGKNGIGTPKLHDSWWLNEQEKSASFCSRICCPWK